MNTLHYRLRVRDAQDESDLLSISSVRTDDNPYVAEPPSGDGEELDPLTGKVTVGAYTISVIDAVGEVGGVGLELIVDFGDYADTTELLADWTESDPADIGTWTLVTPFQHLDSVRVPQVVVDGTFASGASSRLQKTFTGFAPGASVLVSWSQWETTLPAHGPLNNWNPVGPFGLVADSAGEVTVTLSWLMFNDATVDNGLIQFDRLRLRGQFDGGDGRIVTSVLSDAAAKQQLLSKKAFIEISKDGGTEWDVMLAGYVNRVALVTALRYEFTVGESKRVEQTRKVFDRLPDPVTQPTLCSRHLGNAISGVAPTLDRASCIIGGPILGDWGPSIDRGRPIFRVGFVAGQIVRLEWVEGWVSSAFNESGPPVRDHVATFMNDAALEYLDATAPTTALGDFAASVQPLPGLVTRIWDVSSGDWVADHTPLAWSPDNALFRRMVDDWVFCGTGVNFFVLWSGTPPSVGDRMRVAVFPSSVSQRNPFHVSGHPVDIATQVLTYGGIPFDIAAAQSVKAALGNLKVHLRITESATIQEWLEQTLYAPFGFATRANAAGEAEFFQTRINGQNAIATITLADLFSDDGTAWEIEEASAANLVTWESKSFLMQTERPDASFPIDMVLDADITVTVKAEDAEGQAVFGEKEVRFTLPGEIQGYSSSGDAANPGTLDLFVAAIAQPLFDWNGRGAIHGEFHVGRWSDAYDAVIGEELIVNCPHIPSAALGQNPTSQRGTVARRGFVLHKTVSPSGATFMLEDRGPTRLLIPGPSGGLVDGGYLVPTFTLAADATTPKKVVEVTVTNEEDLDLAAVVVRVEMSTDAAPTAGQYVRTWTPGIGDTPFDLPPVCAGSLVSVRMRAEGTGAQAGAFGPWSEFATIDLDDLTPPTGLAATVEGTHLVATWTIGELAVPVEVLYRLLTETEYTGRAVLPAGSVSHTFAVPSAEADYEIAVRHVDGDCRSALATVEVTTDVALTLQPPIDPVAFSDGHGHHGLEVTAREIPSATEFWWAVETDVGTGEACDYQLVGTVTSVEDGRTRFQHPLVAAQDGLLHFWKARHIKNGFEPSGFTDPVSIFPWLIIPPNPNPGVPPDEWDADPGDGFTGAVFPVLSHRAGPMPWGFRSTRLTAEVTPLSRDNIVEEWAPLDGVSHVFMTCQVHQSSVPPGAWLGYQFTVDDGVSWDFLGVGGTGPDVRVDPDSLTADGVLKGEWVELVEEARALVRVRPVFFGGDGTGTLILGGDCLWAFRAPAAVPIEIPDPPIEHPDIDPEPVPTGCNGIDEMPSFAKLVGWWIADCSEVQLVGGRPTIVQILDQSGNGNHLTGHGISGQYVLLGETQTGGPVNLAGRKMAIFDAAYLLFPAGMMTGVTDATMTVVLKGLNGDPGLAVNYVYSWKLGSWPDQPIYAGNGNFIFGGGNLGHIHEDFGSTLRHDLGDPGPALDDWRVFTVQGASAKYRTTIDGTEFTDTTSNTVGWAAQGRFGGRGNNSRLAVAEIVIHSGLTEAELEDVVATVGDRWGLTVVGGSVGGDVGEPGPPPNTGAGPGGDEEVPDPPPGGWPPPISGGARPFGISAIPSAGFAYWNNTVKVFTPGNTANLIASATSGGAKLYLKPGPEAGWLDAAGRFSYDRYAAQVRALATDETVWNAITAAAAHANRYVWAIWMIDEPFHKTRYGGPIPFATVERMAGLWKSHFPALPIILRVDPTDARMPRAVVGVDIMWAEYKLSSGPVESFKATRIAAAQDLGVGIILGIHYEAFDRPTSGLLITADELRHYGGVLARSSVPLAFGGWRWSNELWRKPGIPEAVRYVRDLFASYDP